MIRMSKDIVRGTLEAVVIAFCAMSITALESCSDRYSISGTSLQSIYGANMAFLKSPSNSQTIDSCEIIHGKFNMNGLLDSVQCLALVLGNMNVPVVLEHGNIQVSFANSSLTVSGTPLNDKFYSFLTSRDSLTMLINELPSKESRMILEGVPEDEMFKMLGEEEAELRSALDKMDSDFITDNYDNVLGVTWFLRLCNVESLKFGFPTTSPMLDEIYGKAPDSFRQNEEIVSFMNKVNGK